MDPLRLQLLLTVTLDACGLTGAQAYGVAYHAACALKQRWPLVNIEVPYGATPYIMPIGMN